MSARENGSGDFTIRMIQPAGCLDHADVLLTGDSGEFRTRVDAHLGRAIHAELSGLSSDYTAFIDLLRAALASRGSSFSHVPLSEGVPATAAIVFNSSGEATGVRGLPQGVPLLIAARFHFPVRLVGSSQQPADVPEPFRRFLEQLSLEGRGLEGKNVLVLCG